MRWVRWAAVAIIVGTAAACGEDEEVLPNDESPTSTASVTPASPTVPVDSATPIATIARLTYTHPQYGYSFTYPAGWFVLAAKRLSPYHYAIRNSTVSRSPSMVVQPTIPLSPVLPAR
jgi:hypothetical protein